MPTLAALIPTFRRHELIPLVVRSLQLQTRPPDRILLVGSRDPAMQLLAEALGCEYLDTPNRPLGAKWNAGWQALRGADVAMIVGSDDLVGPAWCARVLDAFAQQPDALMVGPDDSHLLDLRGWRLKHFPGYGDERPDTSGAGRAYSAAVLDTVDWRPAEDQANRGLDGGCFRRVAAASPDRPVVRLRTDPESCLLDIKLRGNITAFDAVAGPAEAASEGWLRARFAEATVDDLLLLRTGLLEAPADPAQLESAVSHAQTLAASGQPAGAAERLGEAFQQAPSHRALAECLLQIGSLAAVARRLAGGDNREDARSAAEVLVRAGWMNPAVLEDPRLVPATRATVPGRP